MMAARWLSSSALVISVSIIPGATQFLSMIPRKDGILLGQTWERGESSLEPSATESQRVMEGLTQFFADMD